ncbi:MAG: hypothetical protein HQK83_00540 [Fibrobacteria bacterium]|nr:hypothetical protein [Fibrobacteria bacterium]
MPVPKSFQNNVSRITVHSIISVVFFLSLFFVLCQCGTDQNPIIENRQIDSIPVLGLKLLPKRKYFPQMDTLPVFVQGYNKGFECAEIKIFELAIEQDTVKLNARVMFPEMIDACALVASGGQDSIIPLKLTQDVNDGVTLFFVNSSDTVTDSILFTYKETITLFRDSVLLLDSTVNKDSIVPLRDYFQDSLLISCGDSVDFGYYCLDSASDTLHLHLWVNGVRGWVSDCDSSYTYLPDSTFFHAFTSPTEIGCSKFAEDSLRYYGNTPLLP